MCKACGCSFRSREFGSIEKFAEPCILLLLFKNSSHGYGLMEDLEEKCGEKVDIGNLYRTLRKMEMMGWIKSSWDKNKAGPDRRVYSITEDGKKVLTDTVSSLDKTDKLLHRFFEGYKQEFKGGNSNI